MGGLTTGGSPEKKKINERGKETPQKKQPMTTPNERGLLSFDNQRDVEGGEGMEGEKFYK